MSDGHKLEGGIWASCGHKLKKGEGDFPTITLSDGADFDGYYRSSLHGSACRECYEWMKAAGILVTQEEADRWIKEGEVPERLKCRAEESES